MRTEQLPGLITMVSKAPSIGKACQCPAPGLSVRVEVEDHSLVVTATRVGATVGRAAARHRDVAADLDAGAASVGGRAAVELEPEVDFGVADGLAIQSSGEADRQYLAQVLVDSGTGLSVALTVLANSDPMVFESGKRLLVGLGCGADEPDEGGAGAGEFAVGPAVRVWT